jgi:signal transduction histidine kinase
MDQSSELTLVFWVGTTIMLFLVFGLLFMATFYQRSVAKMKRREAETLLKTALDSEKKERTRIAKDLHDSVQGDLGAIRNFLMHYRKSTTDTSNQELLEHINEALVQTIENTRLISHKLIPPMLENDGFVVAVNFYFKNLEKSFQIDFKVFDESRDCEVPQEVAYELFRVVQEFTNNMLKYGKISKCYIYINQESKELTLTLIDDGQAFDFKKQYQNSKGAGLQNIQSRLNSIGAKLEQRSVAKGNHFIIHLKQTT